MSWIKTALEVVRAAIDVAKLFRPRSKKPGPEVPPIKPSDLR